MLTGNEETAQIYAYIFSNQTKQVYRELVKFRRRAAYFEYIVQLLQKALAEEMTVQEINEWCVDTLEWMQKRNASILGTQVAVTRKPDVITVAGNVQKPVAQEFVAEAERMFAPTADRTQLKTRPKKKGGVKKYKLLIPVDLELHEKIKLEERQKHAIDVLYELLPERYETTSRRRKLRKLFHEEAAFKSHFFAVWALNTFSALRNRVMNGACRQKVMSSEYIDPLAFMIDNSAALFKINQDLVSSKSNNNTAGSINTISGGGNGAYNKLGNSVKDSMGFIGENTATTGTTNMMDDVRDVSEFMSSVMSGAKTFEEIEKQSSIGNEFVESIGNIFEKFKISTVS